MTIGKVLWLCVAFSASALAAAKPDQVKSQQSIAQADIELAVKIIETLEAGGKVCGPEPFQVTGSRLWRRPCITGDKIKPETWNGIYTTLRKMKDKYACQQQTASAPSAEKCAALFKPPAPERHEIKSYQIR